MPKAITTHPCTSCAAHFLHLTGCTHAAPGTTVSTGNQTLLAPVKRTVFIPDPIPDN